MLKPTGSRPKVLARDQIVRVRRAVRRLGKTASMDRRRRARAPARAVHHYVNGRACSAWKSRAYGLALIGLDGIAGQLSIANAIPLVLRGPKLQNLVRARYAFYPFPLAIFAGVGMNFALRGNGRATTIRAIGLGFGHLASLLLVYLVPPTLFPNGAVDWAEANHLAKEDAAGRTVYLPSLKPATRYWNIVLSGESAQLTRFFGVDTVADYPELVLYRLRSY